VLEQDEVAAVRGELDGECGVAGEAERDHSVGRTLGDLEEGPSRQRARRETHERVGAPARPLPAARRPAEPRDLGPDGDDEGNARGLTGETEAEAGRRFLAQVLERSAGADGPQLPRGRGED